MAQHLFSFLTTSLIMSVIIMGALAAITFMPKKFSPRLRYLTWIVVLLGLVIPIRPFLGQGLFAIELPPTLSTHGQMYATDVSLNVLQVTLDFTEGVRLVGDEQAISIVSVVAVFWAITALAIFTFHIWRYIWFIRLIRRWGVTVNDVAVLSIFHNIKTEKGIKRNIVLKKCPFISTSMLVGFIRPLVLLPDKHYESDELELIFRHELIHYKRSDLYIKLLSVIATSLHWFNPAIYLMSYAMQADCEASCDEKVLKEVGGEHNQFYAEIIMDMIGGKGCKGTQLSTCFYGGKRGIKIRMETIMDGTISITKVSLSAILILSITLTVLSGSVFAFSNYAPQEPTPASHTNFDDLDLLITAMQAREIALEEVGGGILSELFYDHLLEVFRIEILQGGYRFYLGIDASDGGVMIYRMEKVAMQSITWARAMEIALGIIENSQLISGGMEIISGVQIFMFHIEADGRDFEIVIGPDGEILINEYSD